ncbi:MAG: hypothetical protein A3G73_03805 [Rhodospirillales bacterium RIFCSPLOWO2_12_FULL_67_15]|nr:MAG: hypothetical protein A3G73_03805 [Rhodospirillales bacterium RIFCSPLOWO2_12_FULL_67_15]
MIVLGLVAACRAPEDSGQVRWQQPNVDETRMLGDEQDCRRRATAEVERETRRERIFGDDGLARPGTYDAMMARFDARARADRLAAECMRRRGYAPAPR